MRILYYPNSQAWALLPPETKPQDSKDIEYWQKRQPPQPSKNCHGGHHKKTHCP